MSPVVVLVGTFDTKWREYAFVRSEIEAAGVRVIDIDVGVLADPPVAAAHDAGRVASAGGSTLDDLRRDEGGPANREKAIETMSRGALTIVRELLRRHPALAVFGMGGSGGSAVVSGVMRELPFGVPKLLLSTMASRGTAEYVGDSDMTVMNSVIDIAGLNTLSRTVLRNAAAAIAGMAVSRQRAIDSGSADRPAVAITMLGVTTPAVARIIESLDREGYDCVPFHAIGSGGRSLERLISHGRFVAVIDFTVKEITDQLLGGVFVAGDERMRTAGKTGIPQVIVPGAVEVINFAGLETVPSHLRQRPLVRHNQHVTAVRASADELMTVAREIARRLTDARGPVRVLVPLAGFDSYDKAGGPFHDPEGDGAFVGEFVARLPLEARVELIDAHANDPRFADAVVAAFLDAMTSADTSPDDQHPISTPKE